jgi:hypothetical protein
MKADEQDRQALLRALVAELSHAEPAHLDYDILESYVDGRADAIDREIVESHASFCVSCGRELRDLETFASQIRRHRRLWMPIGVAAAIAAFMIGLFTYFQHSTTGVVALHDGGREVRLLSDGHLAGLSGLTAGDELRIGRAMRAGTLAVPADASQLARAGEALRSVERTSSPIEPLAPIGCIIVSDKPTFEWTSIPGARYRVEVFSDHFRPVADSGLIDATHWTVPQSLPRGATYAWQVTAVTDAGLETTAPAPPAPEARFAVVDETDAQTIQRLSQTGSHLALGVAYAEAGATADAKRELEALAAENRGSDIAVRLLQSLHSR